MYIDDDWKEIIGQKSQINDEYFDSHMPPMDFIAKDDITAEYCKPGDYVLVAGEEGRDYAVSLAQNGCHVVLLYRSQDNIEFVKEIIRDNQLTSPIEQCIYGEVNDMPFFQEGVFDVIVYYGLPLIKVIEAQKEIARVLKDTGVLAIGVQKKMSFFETLLGAKFANTKKEPDQWMVLHLGEPSLQDQIKQDGINQLKQYALLQDAIDETSLLDENVRAIFSNEYYS